MNGRSHPIPGRFVPLAAAVLLLAAVSPPGVTAHGPDPVLSGGLFAQDQALTFAWRSNAAPPAAIQTAVRAAAADATSSRGSRAATFAYASSGSNPIGYGAGNTCGPNGIACFTRDAPNGFTMWFREQGHVFDWGSLKWCQSYTSPPDGCFDAENIALDEFGHVEGLGHHVNLDDDSDYLDAVVQTVSRAKPRSGWNVHKFGPCDVASLQREYDVSSASSTYSRCLDLSTVLTLSAAPASIAYATSTTLTATLKVASTASYDRLRGNAVSGRTVTLQRRSAGTTAWIAVGTMAAGSTGTYRMSITLRGATEFRAIFKTPTAEGLVGDTSPTVSVAVGPCTTQCPLDGGATS